MATFTGNVAGYRMDFLASGKIRVVDIDASNGTSGSQIVELGSKLVFDDGTYQPGVVSETLIDVAPRNWLNGVEAATLADGSYVVAWQREEEDGWHVYSQHFDAAGNALSGEARVSTTPYTVPWGGAEKFVVALANGGYLIQWWSGDFDTSSGYIRHFDASGNPVGDEALLENVGYDRAVTALSDGGYVVAWASTVNGNSNVQAQRYDAAGNAVGAELSVNTTTANSQGSPAIAALEGGGFVVCWQSSNQDGSSHGIYAQRYDVAGNEVGGETRINTTTAGSQHSPEIAALADGGFVVAWEFESRLVTQRFDAAGNAVGGEVNVATGISGSFETAITGLAGGGHVLTWDLGDAGGIRAQCFDAAGNAVGDTITANGITSQGASAPAITALADGGFIITWQAGHPETAGAIYARRFDANGESITNGFFLYGTTGADVINTGLGMQMLNGGNGNDRLAAGIGDDILDGSSGDDALFGGDGDDLLYGRYDNDTLSGGSGNDILLGEYGHDILSGGDGDDILDGDNGADKLAGGAGNDKLLGVTGGDTLQGNEGEDTLLGARGDDVLSGGAHDDHLDGGSDDDSLDGGSGNDFLFGHIGDDALNGGVGNDLLNGWEGTDVLTGGAGADIFRFNTKLSADWNVDVVTDFSRVDDIIQLENLIFKNLAYTGVLKAANFRANADGVAMDGDDYILYETDTGKLYYDIDGSGVTMSKVHFATIGTTTHPALTAADFAVI